MKASDFEIRNYEKLDKILSKLCALVVEGQKTDPDHFGKVAAAVLDPDNNLVARLNCPGKDGRIHAERAAMEAYEEQYGDIPDGSIVLTTLSPCSEHMTERDGPSCTDYINNSNIKKVYCGYTDPTQDENQREFNILETKDVDIRDLCKTFADTFINGVNEGKKNKRKARRRAAYGPSLFGGYGYNAGYSGDSGGDGGGVGEDQHPNEKPMGPETKPTMPKGTVKVDVSDVYDWYKLGQHVSNLKGLGKHDFGKGPPSTILSFGDEDTEHKYINALKKTGLSTTDIDPVDPKQPKGMRKQKVDPTYNVGENFADGKNPQDKGDSKRHGVPTKGSVSSLRKFAKSHDGRAAQLAHWMANMKSGKKK
jgi:pyrimidine deaminase RibD-like protein